MKILYYAISDCGKVRNENQDSFLIPSEGITEGCSDTACCESPAVFAVFDGMGGEQFGGEASAMAKELSEKMIAQSPDYDLNKLMLVINGLICRYMQEFSVNRMGTTAGCVRITDKKAEICNVGDSKIYRIRKNTMEQLSVDHIMYMGQRRVLTQHLGIPVEEMLLEPYNEIFDCAAGDIFLLCSDGLTDMVSQERIADIIIKQSFENAGRILVDEALENGGKDNVTVVLCKIV